MRLLKKLLPALLCFVLLVSFMAGINVSAYEHWIADYTEKAAYGTPVIDGTMSADEWGTALSYGVTVSNDDPITSSVGVPDSAFLDTSTYYFMWDEKGVYIGENRTDAECDFDGNASTPWTTDGSLVFLQVADGDSGINDEDASIHVFYIIGNGDGKIGGQLCYRFAYGESMSETRVIDSTDANSNAGDAEEGIISYGGQIGVSTTDTGWIAEVFIPWSVFQLDVPKWTPSDNALIGLNLIPHDAGESGHEAQLVWVKQQDAVGLSNNDFGGWGILELEANPAAETEPAETAAPVTDTTHATTTSASQTADTFIVSTIIAAIATITLGAVITKKKCK